MQWAVAYIVEEVHRPQCWHDSHIKLLHKSDLNRISLLSRSCIICSWSAAALFVILQNVLDGVQCRFLKGRLLSHGEKVQEVFFLTG